MLGLNGYNVKLLSKPTKLTKPTSASEKSIKGSSSSTCHLENLHYRGDRLIRRVQSASNVGSSSAIKSKVRYNKNPENYSSISHNLDKEKSQSQEQININLKRKKRPFSFASEEEDSIIDLSISTEFNKSNLSKKNFNFEINNLNNYKEATSSTSDTENNNLKEKSNFNKKEKEPSNYNNILLKNKIPSSTLNYELKEQEAESETDEALIEKSDKLLSDVASLCEEINLAETEDNTNNVNNLLLEDDILSHHHNKSSLQLELVDISEVEEEEEEEEEDDDEEIKLITNGIGIEDNNEFISKDLINSDCKNNIGLADNLKENLSQQMSEFNKNGDSSSELKFKKEEKDDETYAKIISTLKLIEEEENKTSGLLSFYGSEKSSKSPIGIMAITPPSSCACNFQSPSPMAISTENSPRPVIKDKLDKEKETLENWNELELNLTPTATPKIQTKNYIMKINGKENDVELLDIVDQSSQEIFSFLDEVEKTDREMLFNIKFEKVPNNDEGASSSTESHWDKRSILKKQEFSAQTMDNLIRKGSVELAREVLNYQAKLEEATHSISTLEDTLLNQRELNIRNLKSAEKDLKKRLKLQQEEFEIALNRQQAFSDQLISEKRALQDKLEKLLKNSELVEEKLNQQITKIQEKHIEEIKRLKKIQDNKEKVKKQKWIGAKTQEIRDMTVKGLEPEVQRIIQRHQQEMSELRAWHKDEMQEIEERLQRKYHMQLQNLREELAKEKEDDIRLEKDILLKRFESDTKQREEEFDTNKRKFNSDLYEERQKLVDEEKKFKELLQENIRKAQIKAEIEIENIKNEYEAKLSNLEKRHEQEVKSLRDIFELEKENIETANAKKYEQGITENETILTDKFNSEKDCELKEKEKKLKEDFEARLIEEQTLAEARLKRMQEKFQDEMNELEKVEKDLKLKLAQVKSQYIEKEEEHFSLKSTINLRDKQNKELTESNMKMLEERANLTALIRREFTAQIELMDEECRQVKSTVVELKSKIKYDQEVHLSEIEKVKAENQTEMNKVLLRVKQTLARKEETIQEMQKFLEKSQFRIKHLEELLEQQRKDFLKSIQTQTTTAKGNKK